MNKERLNEVSDANEIRDNRWAVINGRIYELCTYDHVHVVTVQDATDRSVYNPSFGADVAKAYDELYYEVYREFSNEEQATAFFVQLITQAL